MISFPYVCIIIIIIFIIIIIIIIIIITDLSRKKVLSMIRKYQKSQTADKPMAPRGRATQPLRDTRKTNKAKTPGLSFPSNWLQN